ncbi:MAG TPA: pyruvate kinase [Vicinamibacterales bacterium]|nr:pyruvate kinase [Vicinamibacterales bacterium]
MRHTKIIATIGPASDSDEILDSLIAAGADVFRLNFSHGTHQSQGDTFHRIRAAASRAHREVAILQDLGGPKIRTGLLVDHKPIQVRAGEPLRIATGDFPGGPRRLATSFAGLARSVRPGDRLLLADGSIELRVESTDGVEIVTTVLDGGEIGEHKGINAPGVELATSAITQKDVDDLAFGLSLGVDMVALSFVQSAADLRQARGLLADAGRADVPLVAKLERPQAVEHLDEIIEVSSAVMVARGDLGLEMPLERVPRVQKDITRRGRRAGIPVIVATQVLESMTVEPRPTRAEVNDAANAVDDGVDAIMLADETAAGAYPVKAVQTLDAIIRDAEGSPEADARPALRLAVRDNHEQALCEAAVTLAARGEAHAIVAVTRGGTTARRLSALRPTAPIIAATERTDTARRLTLPWGVVPLSMPIGDNLDEASARIGAALIERGLVATGATAVFVSVSADLGRSDANYLKIQRL